jgi:uncharacterized protein YndB with AHSA1/START domain
MSNQTKLIAEDGKQELFMLREFDLPVELLFKAFTDPGLLVQWMSNNHSQMTVEKMENKSHGCWRFVQRDKTGKEYWFNGVIHEFFAPQRIIRTFEIENSAGKGNVQLEFLTFEAITESSSKLIIQTLYKSNLDRDTMIKYGMEKGANLAHNRLQEIINKLK